MTDSLVGRPVPRKEGRRKVTGQSRYIDDISFPEMLYGATVRSPAPRGRIKSIAFTDDTIPWDEFTIVTAKDVPGANYVALILNDQPYLADEFVNHREEAVVLLAHADKYLLEKARRSVRIEIEPLPAIFSLDDSLNRKEIIWGEDNVFKTYTVEKGNVDEVWAGADLIVEGEYRTGAQEQLYIENNGAIAIANERDGVTVWGSMQCPYYVHKALLKLFALPDDKIRVIQMETGGGFGGKEEYSRRHQCAAARSLSRLRCAAKHLCSRTTFEQGRKRTRPQRGRVSPPQLYTRRTTDRDRTSDS